MFVLLMIFLLLATYFILYENESTTSLRIRNVIIQTHEPKKDDLPIEMKKVMNKNSKKGSRVLYFSGHERRKYIANHYPSALQAYDSLNPGAYKADLFRYIYVYMKGGVYLDSGAELLIKLGDFVEEYDEFIAAIDLVETDLYNAFFAATKGHPILKKVIDLCIERIQNKQYGKGSLWITGPECFGEAFRQSTGHELSEGNHGDNVRLLKFKKDGNIYDHNGLAIIKTKYDNYQQDRSKIPNSRSYQDYWNKREVYK